MSEMIVQVRNKMLRRIGGVNHFVSHNKDYTIQFQFDESWNNVRTKMAVFAYEDGEYGSEIFDGDTCNVPELPREGRILIGVKAGEDLSTELLCIPVCKSADDVITDEYDEPDPKIYEQILDIINNLWNGGTTVYPSPVKFLASPSAAKVGDLIRVKEVDENGDVTQTEGFDVGVELEKKIDAPQVAQVGEVLTVEEIGEDGKPKKWKTQAVQTEPPDWNENDPTKPGYVKNRTHYKYSDEFLGEIEFTATSEKELILKDQNSTENHDIIDAIGKTALTEHNTTKIIIDGEVCISNAFFSRYITSLVGEFNYGAGGPVGYQSPAVVNKDGIVLVSGKVYVIQFYNVGEYYKPLSEKYLPNTIFSQSNAPVKFGSDDDGNINYNSSVQGDYTKASGTGSHAEGNYTEAKAGHSHAEGNFTVASTYGQQVSGRYNIPEDRYREKITPNRTRWISNYSTVFYRSNAWTFNTKTGKYSLTDPEKCSFSEITTGMYYIINDDNSDISMYYLTSLKSVSSGGKTYNCTLYSVVDQEYEYGTYAHIVGNGTSSELSNAYTLDWEGNAWFAGDVYVHSTSGTNKDDGSVRLATVKELSTCFRVNLDPTENDDGTVTYVSDSPASFMYAVMFGPISNPGNSIECYINLNEKGIIVLNFIESHMTRLEDGNMTLSFKFSSYASGKQISAEIKDTISGFQTDDEEILSTVVTVTENAYLPTPATAQVGQIVKVKSVDESGKITETEAVDMSTIVSVTYNEETGNLQIGG